jgi:general secretion pathway protein M
MTLSLPPLVSRVLALAILLLLVGGIYALVVDPLIGEYEVNRDAVAQLSSALGRYRAAERQLPERQATLASLKKADSGGEGFLPDGNDNLVAAGVQTRVKSITETAHGALKSTQILPALDEGKLHRIAIRAQMTVTLEAAQKVFYGIESSTPYLFLDNIAMNARNSPRLRAEVEDNPLIDVQFDVFGFTHGSTK